MAGYDPAKARFGTYARYHAEKFMCAAAQAPSGTLGTA